MKIVKVTPTDDLQSILTNLTQPTHVILAAGEYKCKLVVPPACVKISGESRETTKITNADYAKKAHKDGLEYTTFRTYTVCVTGESCEMENLTIENAATAPEKNGQCVALSVHAKKFCGKNLTLKSTQDTLFCAPFPDDLVARYSGLTPDPVSKAHYYRGFISKEQLLIEGGSVQTYENCKIYGTVDFIFGGAEAYFVGCELISLPEVRGDGYVAAPCHSLASARGFTFINCAFTNGGAAARSVYLARPWRDFGKCDFIGCTLGEHIAPALFDPWNDSYRSSTARFSYHSLTPAHPLTPVPWSRELSDEEVKEILKTCSAL